MHHPLAVLTVLLMTAGGLSGCADDPTGATGSEPSPSASASASATPTAQSSAAPSDSGSPSAPSSSPTRPSGTSVDITIKGGKATPNGDRVKAELDEPITLRITADTAGELHVHSTPEQEVAFPKGASTRTLTITKPGIVDVEDHATEQVIVQLQVS